MEDAKRRPGEHETSSSSVRHLRISPTSGSPVASRGYPESALGRVLGIVAVALGTALVGFSR